MTRDALVTSDELDMHASRLCCRLLIALPFRRRDDFFVRPLLSRLLPSSIQVITVDAGGPLLLAEAGAEAVLADEGMDRYA